MRVRVGFVSLLGLIAGVWLGWAEPPRDAWKLPLLWQTDVKTYLESGPTAADLDGDGLAEVILAGREELVALDGRGKEMWRWRTAGRYMTYPSVLERSGKTPLLYAADTSGLLTCVDGKGKVVWQAKLDDWTDWSATVVCTLEAGQAPMAIQTDRKGSVWAFEAQTGALVWKTSVDGAPVSPAVGELDRDGRSEIAVATGKGLLFLLDSKGAVRWRQPLTGSSQSWSTSAPVIFGGSSTPGSVVVGSSDGQVYCFGADGRLRWKKEVKGAVASGISVGDIDRDGATDIFVVTQLGMVYRFDEMGAVRWEIDTQGRSLAAGAIVDANGDGRLEYVLCTQNGHLMVVDDLGQVVFERQFDHRTINVTPTFADISSSSPGLEMAISGGEAGLVLCFGTTAPKNALTQWPQYRADTRKSGAWFGAGSAEKPAMRPRNLRPTEILAGESIRFDVANPDPSGAERVATAVCTYPGGKRQVARTPVLGKRTELRLDIHPFVAGTYHFSWLMESWPGEVEVWGEEELQLVPLANEKALAERALRALQETADSVEPSAPSPARALRGESVLLQTALDELLRLGPIENSPDGPGKGAEDAVFALVQRARRGLAVSKVVREACQPGHNASVVAFEGALWENQGVDRQLPEVNANPLELSRRVVRGEHDPLSVKLFNVTAGELQIRVLAQTKTPDLKVRALHAVAVPTSVGDLAWDALPPLDGSAVLSIPPLSAREVWLDVDIASPAPGEHVLEVHCQALNAPSVMAGSAPHTAPPPESLVKVTYKVLPFDMASASSLRLCAWASLDSRNAGDLISHGNNVFVAPHGAAKYTDGQETPEIDFSKLDALASLVRDQGAYLLLNGVPALRGELGSDSYLKDLRVFLEREVQHLKELGYLPGTYALYPVDEPGGAGWNAVNTVIAFGKMVRQVDPSIPIYVNGGGELPMFEAMAPYVDIWCPGIYMLSEQTPLMKFVRGTGKTLWTYNCAYAFSRPAGPNIKDTNLVGEFRIQPLYALRYKATGIGYWSYNLGDDMWTRTEMEYPLVYPGQDGPVTSRRWEAVREGIEDYRILTALNALAEERPADQLPEATRQRIQNLIAKGLPALVDQSYAEMTRGLARYVMAQSASEENLDAFRRELLDCVEEVCAPKGISPQGGPK